MHNSAFKMLGIKSEYLSFETKPEQFSETLMSLIERGIEGFNLTIPFKERILPHLSVISEEARAIGAVNSVLVRGGKLLGFNTDIYGIIESLEPFRNRIQCSRALIFGAGGAAKSLIYGLITGFMMEEVTIINRNPDRAEALREHFGKEGFKGIKVENPNEKEMGRMFRDSGLIVNATPLGMYPETEASVLPYNNLFCESNVAFDLIYNPMETSFLKNAKSSGASTIGGLEMLLHQGEKAFHLFTGNEMPLAPIREIVKKKLTQLR